MYDWSWERLGIVADDQDVTEDWDDDDPRLVSYAAHQWLTWLQAACSTPWEFVMLRISRSIADDIIAHARRDHPDEACGVVAGPAGSDEPTRFIPMLNAARSSTFYEFDSLDLLRLYRDMDARDEEPVVIYHSPRRRKRIRRVRMCRMPRSRTRTTCWSALGAAVR